MRRPPVTAALLLVAAVAAAQPAPIHPGRWSPPRWNGRSATRADVPINMVLLRGGDGVHSLVLTLNYDGNPADTVVQAALWAWNPMSEDCGTALDQDFTLVPMNSVPHNPEAGGASVLANGDVLLFGGHEVPEAEVATASAAIFHRDTRTWVPADSMRERRFNGTSTILADGRVLASSGNQFATVIVYGGRVNGGPALDDAVHRVQSTYAGGFSPRLDSTGVWPRARSGHSLAGYPPGPSFLFGGRLSDSTLASDTWALARTGGDVAELLGWTPWIVASPPPARERHAALLLPGAGFNLPTMLVHGGTGTTGAPLSDLWRLRYDTGLGHYVWTLLGAADVDGAPPAARAGHAAAWNEAANIAVVFGGREANGALSDSLWVLATPGARPAWKRPAVISASRPSGRWLHALAMDPNPHVRGDGRTWIRAFVWGGETAGGRAGDLWALWVRTAGDTAEWVPMTVNGSSPAARREASLVYYDQQDRLFLMGGDTGGSSDPLAWSLDLGIGATGWRALAAGGFSLAGQGAVIDPTFYTSIHPEVYDPATGHWTPYSTPHVQQAFPYMFVDTTGKVFEAGPTTNLYPTWMFDPASDTWQKFPADTSQLDGGSAAMYRPGKVMKCGDRFVYGSASAESRWIDLDAPSPNWQRTANAMASGRTTHNLVMLPDGEVLVVGGTKTPGNGDPAGRPEIWDPDYVSPDGHRGWWYGGLAPDTLAADTMVRGYHSTAVLLPDARVLCGGGIFDDPHDIQLNLYCPPYLFNADGCPATRPRLDGAPAAVAYGDTFTVASPDSIARAVLIRPASATHSNDEDQRWVPLARAGGAAPSVRFVAPSGGTIAPPGDYLLFVLSPARVPSIARWITVGAPGAVAVPARAAPLLALAPAAPNPSRGVTTLRFTLARRSAVRLELFDAGGRRVRGVEMGSLGAGTHAVAWDGRDARGNPVAPGLYYARLSAGAQTLRTTIARLR